MRLLSLSTLLLLAVSCEGRGPSGLLRQGALPIQDFPMYMSDSNAGIVYRIQRDGTKEVYVNNLLSPKGLTTDKFQNLYIAEYGMDRVLKINTLIEETFDANDCTTSSKNDCQIINDTLSSPSSVATDSSNEVYVTNEGTNSIIRVNDNETVKTFSSRPTSLEFGVNDLLIVALSGADKVIWGEETEETTTEMFAPVGVGVDGNGRVYAIPGSGGSNLTDCNSHFTGKIDGTDVLYSEQASLMFNVNIVRYQQTEPGSDCGTNVAIAAPSANGVTVDTVGNVYMTSQRIVLPDSTTTKGIVVYPYSGNPFFFVTDDVNFMIPADVTLTKY